MNKLYLINCSIPFYFLWHSGLKVNIVKKNRNRNANPNPPNYQNAPKLKMTKVI